MTITSSIDRVIAISKEYNSSMSSSSVDIHEVIDTIFEENPYQQKIIELLDSIDEHDAIVLMNLMYLGCEINEHESFQDCYDRIKRTVEQNKKHVYLKFDEKIPVLDRYISRAIELAKKNGVQIEHL
ncbi:TPA: hypothetical protein QH450_002036 [Providencia alcalifaciens]|nr:hypothetical protein [Providencia alcalifaciens]